MFIPQHLMKNATEYENEPAISWKNDADNWETMRLINKYTAKNNLPLLSISVIGFDIQVILFENTTHHHLCLECIFPNLNEPELARCETVGNHMKFMCSNVLKLYGTRAQRTCPACLGQGLEHV